MPKTTWFHVCICNVQTSLDLKYKDCDICGITKAQAAKRYPKRNAHLVKKEKKK